LDELFLIVIVGEFNAGKSALVNTLLGERVLPEGATPTTSSVTLVKWGERSVQQIVDEGFSVHTHPLPLLKELNIVDTPGTNAIIRQHERLTDEFVERPCVIHHSADHPMTERTPPSADPSGEKVVFVITNRTSWTMMPPSRSHNLCPQTQLPSWVRPELFPVSAGGQPGTGRMILSSG
jgi:hypothetical protein